MRFLVTMLFGLLVCAVLTGPTAGHAQKGKYLGLVGGFNSTDWRAPSLDSTFKAIIKPLGGVSGGIMFNDSWGARVEVLYAQKSATKQATGQVWRGDYIQIPLLAQLSVSFSDFSSGRFLISAGPTVAFNIKCTFGDVTCTDTQEAIPSPDGTDVTLMAALGFGAGPVIFDVRYDLGIADINTREGEDQVKTYSFWVTLSYYLPIGK